MTTDAQDWTVLDRLVTRGPYWPITALDSIPRLTDHGWATHDTQAGKLVATDAGRAYHEAHRSRSPEELDAWFAAGRLHSRQVWLRAADIVAERGVHLSDAYQGGVDPHDALREAADEIGLFLPAIEAQASFGLAKLEAGQTAEQVVAMMRNYAQQAGT